MTRTPHLLLFSLVLTLSGSGAAAAQDHLHPPLPSPPDPLLKMVLEGPHLVLAHDAFLGLTRPQVERLRPLAAEVCGAEVEYHRGVARLRAHLSSLLDDGADEGALLVVLDSLAELERVWMVALIRGRSGTQAELDPGQRAQLTWLGDHWSGEAGTMIAAATHPGHRGHPGTQVPIRVPGMVVGETSLLPFCEALHGPAVHISIPPPR